MESIFKVKVQTNPDPRWLYPSERRYSASIVLGLGVVHLAFASSALLMACLSVTSKHNIQKIDNWLIPNDNINNDEFDTNHFDEIDLDAILTVGPCLICIGAVAAGFTGILAWKRWFIDHNIKLFFVMSLISIATSTIAIILESLVMVYLNNYCYSKELIQKTINLKSKDVIIINILITAVLEWVWSFLSIKVSFEGMRKDYPEEVEAAKDQGKVKVNTIHKGNVKNKDIQSDVINHVNKTLNKFHKKPNSNLPKDESHSEYCERVNKFLSSNVHSASI
ncbi:hypothetical protein RN001_001038 [Aquatica leii]|uniref:Uncharacterized protein n=1 Tax=Aquatica leii TaxID=1421715 RepID=A0AAN7Q7L7_9COLE|nr:hypothetical protein RN001_001038 [Aquatica leii]